MTRTQQRRPASRLGAVYAVPSSTSGDNHSVQCAHYGAHAPTLLNSPAGAAPEAQSAGNIGAEQTGSPSPSWHYAKNVSHLSRAQPGERGYRRFTRSAQREVLWQESDLPRVRKCGRVRSSAEDDVGMWDNAGVWHYTGLVTCGSIWACPVCSAKIRHTRAQEISAAAAAWHQAGNIVLMVTLTFPHYDGLALADTLPVLSEGFRQLISGKAWAGTPERFVPARPSKRGGMLPARIIPAKLGLRDRLGIVGTIRAVEVTHGANGWHPHAHVLVFIEGDDVEPVAHLGIYLRERWRKWITGQGLPAPHRIHGVDYKVCHSAAVAGEYCAKTQDGRAVGNEMARADMKTGHGEGRTPFEILDDFRWTGDKADLDLWHEYERATHGRQCITWSAGLHERFAVAQRTDEEVAAELVGGVAQADISPEVWREITSVPGLPAYLLELGERGGVTAVNAELGRRGIGKVRSISARGDPGG